MMQITLLRDADLVDLEKKVNLELMSLSHENHFVITVRVFVEPETNMHPQQFIAQINYK